MLWRRSKLGLRLSREQAAALDEFMDGASAAPRRGARNPCDSAMEARRRGYHARADNVTKTVARRRRISATSRCTLEHGSLNVLLGPTLSGKTSLMRLMAGLDAPTSGDVCVDGKDVTGVPVQQRNVAMVYQQFINYPSLSVYENIASPLRVAGLPTGRDRQPGAARRQRCSS